MESTRTYRELMKQNLPQVAKLLKECASEDARFFIDVEDIKEIEEHMHNDESGITVTCAEGKNRTDGSKAIREMIEKPALHHVILISDGGKIGDFGSIISKVPMDNVDTDVTYGLVRRKDAKSEYNIYCISYR